MVWHIYEKYMKFLMWLPLILLVIALAMLMNSYFSTGYFILPGTELAGGKTITVPVDEVDLNKIDEALPYATVRLSSGAQKSILVELPIERNETEVISQLNRLVEFKGEPSVKIVGPAIAGVFFQQAQIAVIIAFISMAFVVFLIFRSFVPSSLVILAATTDLVVTVAVTNAIGVKLSMPVIAALLTIIGYSVDTDILLTTELLRGDRQKTSQNIKRAVKTGLTLTSTALAALVALYFMSGSFVLEEIALVLIIGLLIDMPATWFTNAGLLRKWLEKHERTD